MSDVTLRLTSAESHGSMLSARLEVGDAFDLVRDMWFTRIELDQFNMEVARADHLPPISAPQFGVYLCDMDRADTHVVKAVATVMLADSTMQSTAAVVLTPTTPMPVANVLGDVHATLEYGRLFVSATPGSAASWKCWARRDAEPTVSGLPSGTPDNVFLRFDAARDELSFEMPLSGTPGTTVWHVIATGYSSSNVEGPRFSFALPFTYNGSPDPVMTTAVRPVYGSQQRQVEAVESLTEFTTWLAKYQQRGYIGEVGWTRVGGLNWNTVALSWYALANQAGLWVTAWATGELWPSDYMLQPYEKVNGTWQAHDQAQVLELDANLHPAGCLRGVNVAGAEFKAPVLDASTTWFSNRNVGVHGSDYKWNGLATYQYLASKGQVLARIPFRWERIQPVLGAALDATELARMTDSINAAGQAGMQVILDVHNYGAYWLDAAGSGTGVRYTIGTPQVTFAHFADLWSRLTAAFADNAAVVAFGLMNEPVSMTPAPGMTPATTWETAAQRAVEAIRAAEGARPPRWIMVGGYMWSGTWSLPTKDKVPFITDPANHMMYEAHQYWDADRSGRYDANELDPDPQENWVRWSPNAAMWAYQSAGGEGSEAYSVEVFKAGQAAALCDLVLWKQGYADLLTFCDDPAASGCAHHTNEYRLIATNHLDGSVLQFAATASLSTR